MANTSPQVKSYLGKEYTEALQKTSKNKNHNAKESLVKPELMTNTTPQVKIYCGKESPEAFQKRLKKSRLDELEMYKHNLFRKEYKQWLLDEKENAKK